MDEPSAPSGSVTMWLQRLRDGDSGALDRLLPLVYDELRVLARSQLRRERPGHTLGATGLVHEAYVRLSGREGLSPADRRQFFGIAAQAMRRVLIDYARTRNRKKRGGGQPIESIEAHPLLTDQAAGEIVAIDAALERLTNANPRAARVVELRFFAGLTLEETADVLGVSLKTVQRDWLVARAWLRKEIGTDTAIDVPEEPAGE